MSSCSSIPDAFLYSTLGDVFTAYEVGTNRLVAIKRVDLDMYKPPKRDFRRLENAILRMRILHFNNLVNNVDSRDENIYFLDSFLYKNELWAVVERMKGGSLREVVTAKFMTEGQIATVSREITKGLQYLHRWNLVHRDIKSDNVFLSLTGDVKISTYHGLPPLK